MKSPPYLMSQFYQCKVYHILQKRKVTKQRKIAKIPEKTGLLGAGAAQERRFYVMMESQTRILGRDGIKSIHAEVFV